MKSGEMPGPPRIAEDQGYFAVPAHRRFEQLPEPSGIRGELHTMALRLSQPASKVKRWSPAALGTARSRARNLDIGECANLPIICACIRADHGPSGAAA